MDPVKVQGQLNNSPIQQLVNATKTAEPGSLGASFKNILDGVLVAQNQFNPATPVPTALPSPFPLPNQVNVQSAVERSDQLIAQLLEEDAEFADPIQEADEEAEPFLEPDSIIEESSRSSRLEVTPFQFFLDKAIDFFRRVSGMERRADELMEAFARGEISLEEMAIEKVKAGVAIEYSITLVTQTTQAFNELKNMQI